MHLGVRKTSALLVALLVIGLASAPVVGCWGRKPDLEVVRLDSGLVRGFSQEEVWTYLGIPFAEPPVGDLRWKEPQPVKSWTGVRECKEFGPVPPQPKDPTTPEGLKEIEGSEDCLFLNVWTPAGKSNEKLPVMIWIYGGAYNMGSASSALYDGRKLASKGVVVVTFNYRIGPLGFLSHPLLARESPNGACGNYGLLDQVEALKWVKRNISGFGGDSGCVTVFGESAGAMSVLNLTVSPLTEGLFHRAISESAPAFDEGLLMRAVNDLGSAFQTGEQFAAAMGCDNAPDVLASLRSKSVGEVFSFPLTEEGLFMSTVKFMPVVDGWLLPDKPGVLLAQGKQHDIPLLIGSNAQEGNLFTYAASLLEDPRVTAAGYRERIQQYYGGFADRVLELYPVEEDADVPGALSNLYTVMDFTSVARFTAASMASKNSEVYLYQFSRVPPKDKLGACHGIEIPYVFGNLINDPKLNQDNMSDLSLFWEELKHDAKEGLAFILDKKDFDISNSMMSYWANFAATGNPNGDGLVEWPAYRSDSDRNLEIGDSMRTETGLHKNGCDLADEIYRAEGSI